MMIKYLDLTFNGLIPLIIKSEGQQATIVLQKLSSLLDVPLTENTVRNSIQIILRSEKMLLPKDAQIVKHVQYQLFKENESIVLLFDDTICNDYPPEDLELFQIRYPIMQLMMQITLQNKNYIMMHGAMLVDCENKATIMIAPSGVGKSTTAKRFREKGGFAHYDDQMLLSWQEQSNGKLKFFVQGLPTWSKVYECGVKNVTYKYGNCFEVKDIFVLGRGVDKEDIEPLTLIEWHANLVSSFLEHLVWPSQILTISERQRLAQICWDTAKKIDTVFKPKRFNAHLGANIMESLQEK